MVIVIWRRKPIYIVRRTSVMLARLGDHNADLKDPFSLDSDQPEYAKNSLRSRRRDLFVTIGICTHLGGGSHAPAHQATRGLQRFRDRW
jgi:ubiquinol-cytochrome c reductase iron-sulfur subunit